MFAALFKRKRTLSDAEQASLNETARVLQEMCDQHVFVDVRIPGRDQQWRSMLLAVLPNSRLIHMDELFPVGEASELRDGEHVVISCRDRNSSVRLATKVMRVAREGGVPSYFLHLPITCERNQRRECWRMPVEGREDVRVSLQVGSEKSCMVKPLDLSQDGIKLCIPRELDDLEPGRTVLHDCLLSMKDLGCIRCKLVVRNVDDSQLGETVVGASFTALNGFERRQIAGFLASSQRSMLRRLAA